MRPVRVGHRHAEATGDSVTVVCFVWWGRCVGNDWVRVGGVARGLRV